MILLFSVFAVSFSSAPQPLHTMLKPLQLKKYLVTIYNLFVELSIYTSKLLLFLDFPLELVFWLHHVVMNGKICLCRYNVFQIGFIVLAGLTFVYYAAFVSLSVTV